MREIEVRPAQPRTTVHVTLPDNRTFEGPVGTTVETFLKVAFPNPKTPLIASLVNGHLR
jgi:hypothetical protein